MTRRMLVEVQKPFAFLCGHADSPSIQDRISGFKAACAAFGVGETLVRLDAEDSTAAGRRLMAALLGDDQASPPAFMCSSLLVLEGALQQLKASAGRIDPQIMIGTFDDHTMLDLLPNRVVSIRQNEAALASRIFARLIEPAAHRQRPSARDVVSGELICRNL